MSIIEASWGRCPTCKGALRVTRATSPAPGTAFQRARTSTECWGDCEGRETVALVYAQVIADNGELMYRQLGEVGAIMQVMVGQGNTHLGYKIVAPRPSLDAVREIMALRTYPIE